MILKNFFLFIFSLLNGISASLFNAKAILLEEQYWYYLIHSLEDKRVYIFRKGICPKMNVIAWLEFELAYYDFAVHRFNHKSMKVIFIFLPNKKIALILLFLV